MAMGLKKPGAAAIVARTACQMSQSVPALERTKVSPARHVAGRHGADEGAAAACLRRRAWIAGVDAAGEPLIKHALAQALFGDQFLDAMLERRHPERVWLVEGFAVELHKKWQMPPHGTAG
jgi:hypothetical protein